MSDKITKTSQIVINGEEPEVLGKKIKLNQEPEFKGLNVNEMIKKALEKK